ncbi:MAG: methylenetetrahydrofolate reductase [Hyphomicrobiales bacterium]
MSNIFQKNINFSYEVFPPQEISNNVKLVEKINALIHKPSFISVTYGAGGSNRDKTMDLVRRIHQDTDIDVAAHLTCVDASISDTMSLVEYYLKIGVNKILALRGDSPNNISKKYTAHPEGFQKTGELIKAIKKLSDIQVYCAGYPETHPDSENLKADIENLKDKVNSGSNDIITQYFFDNNLFYTFSELLDRSKIGANLIPGIIPITNFQKIREFSIKCGASIPKKFEGIFNHHFNNLNNEQQLDIILSIIADQARDLIENGINNLHIYSLNQISLMDQIISKLNIDSVK